MQPKELAQKYDKIASWWQQQHRDSQYGIHQFEQALKFTTQEGQALDVGCGAGGRFINRLLASGFSVDGVDVSPKMIDLARQAHPRGNFYCEDICHWQTNKQYDFILAWDSLFHLPLDQQVPVLKKLTSILKSGGVLFYTFGDAEGDHYDRWRDDDFYYSSVGINKNLEVLLENNMLPKHLELDQFPEKHVMMIAIKAGD
ncbi:MAG: class I SAM-dependent methyltransferase [Cellvibrionaceae bacterium]|nr:class I SAM-dependent methyltransferase [Cellvibrionaceae bacterium]